VALTDAGHGTLEAAIRAVDEAERRFLSPLSAEAAATLRDMLRTTAFSAGVTGG
jgi:hypothetical protein